MSIQAVDQETRAPALPEASRQGSALICSVGVMAYNEEANISRCLQSLVDQQTEVAQMVEIVVVVSGSTDNTVEIVEEFSHQNARIKLITQPTREGKASAVNLFLASTDSPILVVVGADNILPPESLEKIVLPFVDPDVGMTGGHPIPVNDDRKFMGFVVHLLWELHHQIALQRPKLGEFIAFRRIFERIPLTTAVDEAKIEPLVFGQGYRLHYVPEAVVFNRGPDTISEFLKQRRRINAGHLRLRQKYGYRVSTSNGFQILVTLIRNPQPSLRWIIWTPAVIGLEVLARFLGWWDFRWANKQHHIWEVVVSTKEV